MDIPPIREINLCTRPELCKPLYIEKFFVHLDDKIQDLEKESVIEIRQVRKYFKDVRAVDGVDLNIREGEFLALLGPNGAGKTTLVEMVEGLQRQDSGEILILGLPWKGNELHLRGQLGISLQETRFIDKLRTREVLELFASFHKIDGSRVKEVLEMIRLQDKSRAFTVNLSGGQRQRLALGIALLNEPSILLLDEPTTGLDPNSRHEIWDILMEFKRTRGTTMILTTHYMEEAAFLCDRIVIMDQGRIIAQGGLEELLNQNQSEEIIEFSPSGDPAKLELESMPWLRKYTFDAARNKLTLFVTGIMEALPDIMERSESRGTGIRALTCRRMTLDDLFISLTGRRLVE
jgi:ABC-2 type transport system ATP-binding protein